MNPADSLFLSLSKVDQSLETFWDVRSPFIPQANFCRPSLQQQTDDSALSNAFLEEKAVNIRRMRELQNSAMDRKLANIAKMGEDIEIAYNQKAARRKKLSQQTDESQQRKNERAHRSQQEKDEADRKKTQRAHRSQQERDEADRKKTEIKEWYTVSVYSFMKVIFELYLNRLHQKIA